jgi:hypothetical protein
MYGAPSTTSPRLARTRAYSRYGFARECVRGVGVGERTGALRGARSYVLASPGRLARTTYVPTYFRTYVGLTSSTLWLATSTLKAAGAGGEGDVTPSPSTAPVS